MSEHEPNPEALKAELAEIDEKIAGTDKELLFVRVSYDLHQITESEFGLRKKELSIKSEGLKKKSLEILTLLGDYQEIENRLREYADEVIELMGDEMPISSNEMLYSVFGVTTATDRLPEGVTKIVTELSETYLILPDDEASENEHFTADEPDE